MAEALFYHLTTQPLERALPDLLERTLQKGWRAVVRVGGAERMQSLDMHLWTYRDESFLPHAKMGCEKPEQQLIYLTTGDDVPNDADVLFLVDAADTSDFDAFTRTIVMFTDADAEALSLARQQWKRAVLQTRATYWQQNPNGGWSKAAEGGPDTKTPD